MKRLVSIVFVALVLLCSCEVELPSVVKVHDVKLKGFNPLSKELKIEYVADIFQPNPIAFTLDEIRTKIYIDELYMGSGLTLTKIVIPSRDTMSSRISQELDMKSFIKTIKTLKNKKEVALRLESEFHIIADNEGWSIPYKYEETIIFKDELEDLIKIKF